MATINGTTGNDTLVGTANDDTLQSGAGNDSVSGGDGNDYLYDTGGRDALDGNDGNDTVQAESGYDTLNGGNGNDSLIGYGGHDLINGDPGSDTIQADTGWNTLAGGEGNDYIYGSTGNDTLEGGDGNDYLSGSAGNDSLNGGAGDDALYGGSGNDRLVSGSNNPYYSYGDDLNGGYGNDTLVAEGQLATLEGGCGDDTYSIEWQSATASNPATVTIYEITQVGSNDILDLTSVVSDISQLRFSSSTSYGEIGITVRDTNGDVIGSIDINHWHNDPINIESIKIGSQLYSLSGSTNAEDLNSRFIYHATSAANTIAITMDFDALRGFGGNDTLSTAYDYSTLLGDAGNDRLTASGDYDLLDGGVGRDTIVISGNHSRGYGNTDNDTLRASGCADALYGGDGNDLLTATGQSSYLDGGNGNDNLHISANDGRLIGGAGNDTLTVDGYSLATLTGDAGDDRYILGAPTAGTFNVTIDSPYYSDGGLGTDILDLSAVADSLDDIRFVDDVNNSLTLQILGSNGAVEGTVLLGQQYRVGSSGGVAVDTLFIDGHSYDLTTAHNAAELNSLYRYHTTDAADVVTSQQDYDAIAGLGGNDTLSISGDHALLSGGNGDDSLSASGLYDTLSGGQGHDILTSSGGAGFLHGDEGNDTLIASGDGTYLYGDAGDDSFLLSGSSSRAYGGEGNDTLVSSAGSYVSLNGDAGNDSLVAGGNYDSLSGGNNNDTLDLGGYSQGHSSGGAGDDLIRVGSLTSSATNSFSDTVTGDAGSDTLEIADADAIARIEFGHGFYSWSSDLQVFAVDANGDTIGTVLLQYQFGGWSTTETLVIGSQSYDLTAGSSAAELNALYSFGIGNNADSVTLSGDYRELSGLGGDDTLTASGDRNFLYGGDGNDSLASKGDYGLLSGENGDDSLNLVGDWSTLQGGDGNDSLEATGLANSLFGEAGNDTLIAGGCADTLDGGAGNDVITITGSSSTGYGGNGDDSLSTSGYYSNLHGGDGNDTLTANGDGGNLYGETGDDLYVIGAGAASSWTDISEAYSGGGNDTLDLSAVANDITDLSFRGSSSIDIILRDSNGDRTGSVSLYGQNFTSGNYQIETLLIDGKTYDLTAISNGDQLNSALVYGASNGDDNITVTRSSDAVHSGAGNDTLTAAADNDSLYGGDGNDRLVATASHGGGLVGGNGDDTYVVDWASASRGDQAWLSINDIAGSHGGGNDVLDLSAIAADLDHISFSSDNGSGLQIVVYDNNGDRIGRVSVANEFPSSGLGSIETLILGDGSYDLTVANNGYQLNSIYKYGTGSGDDVATATDNGTYLYGFDGNDTLSTTADYSSLLGGNGDDDLHSGDVRYVHLYGENGNDRYVVDWTTNDPAHVHTIDITEGFNATGSNGDILDLSAVADSLDDLQFIDDFYDLRIDVNDANGDTVGRITIDYELSSHMIETLVVGGQSYDMTLAHSGGELYSIFRYGASNGDDSLVGAGLHSNESLYGLAGNDTLRASTAYTSLFGGDGNDLLESGGYSGNLYGGQGSDTYVVTWDHVPSGVFTITSVYDDGASNDGSVDVLDLNGAISDIGNIEIAGNGSYKQIYVFDDTGRQIRTVNTNNIETLLLGGHSYDLTATGFDLGSRYVFGVSNGDDSVVNNHFGGTVHGALGNDTLTATNGHENLFGDEGDDRLIATSGDYVSLTGGSGNDTYVINWQDASSSNIAYTNIYGSSSPAGNDTLDLSAVASDLSHVRFQFDGYAVYALVTDDAGAVKGVVDITDSLYSAYPRTVSTLVVGQDTLDISGATNVTELNALISDITGDIDQAENGTAGNDTLHGYSGNDTLTGGSGDDSLFGDANNDQLDGGAGADTLDGGAGNDIARYDHSSAGVTVYLDGTPGVGGEAAGDVLTGIETVIGSAYNDALIGDVNSNSLWGKNGNDSLDGGDGADTLVGGAGADTLVGGTGTDQAYYADSSAAVTVNLTTGVNSGGDAQGDVLSGIENVFGSAYDDSLTGDAGRNALYGQTGDDTLTGGGGDDILIGGSGADSFVFGSGWGNDTVIDYDGTADSLDLSSTGLTFADLTVTQQGSDVLVSDGSNSILLKNTSAGAIDATALNIAVGVTTISGTAASEVLHGTQYGEEIDGGDGHDTLMGGEGADTLVGGNGTDQANYASSSAAITVNLATGVNTGGDAEGDVLSGIENVYGSVYDDSLTGDAGRNALYGQTGNDTLTGGGGNDILIGGSGADSFIFGSGWGNDTVIDYDGTTDHLDMSGTGLTFSDLTVTQQGSNTLISDGSNSILLKNTSAGSIDAASLNIDAGGVSTVSGTGSSEVLHGTQNGEEIDGLDGHDTLMGSAGADTLVGGAGTDQANYASSSAAVAVNLATGVNSGGDAEGDVLSGIENVYGSVYDDSLTGDAGRNALYGQTGNDTLTGGGGNDILIGGSGSDTFVFGSGWGNDTIIDYDGNADHLDMSGTGLTFADLTVTQQGSDALVSDGSNSILLRNTNAGSIDATALNIAAGGVSTISGTAASEVLHGTQNGEEIDGGDGHDTLMGGEGADTLVGGNGVDQAYYASSSAAVTVNLTTGVNTGGDAEGDVLMGIENVYGSVYDDSLTGDAGRNALYGQTGNDTLTGGGGNDILIGGSGADSFVFGTGWGNDTVIDYDGTTDHLDLSGTGLTFSDLTVTQQGANTLISDGSNSILLRNTSAGSIDATALNIAAGGITTISGTAGADVLDGTSGDNLLSGGAGNDQLYGSDGADTLDGGAGNDMVRYDHSTAGVTVYLDGTPGVGGEAAGDVLTGIETVIGSAYDDSLTGDANRNSLWGRNGNDSLDGGAGDDTLLGGAGADTLVGGTGTDQAYYGGSSAAVTVNLATGTGTGGEAEGDVLSGIEGVFGSSHDDSLTGDSGNNILYGQTGNDTLTGGAGDDILFGGTGADSFVFGSGWGNDTIRDFEDGTDLIDMSTSGLVYANLTITQQGSDVLIDDGSSDTILLIGVSLSNIDASDFVF